MRGWATAVCAILLPGCGALDQFARGCDRDGLCESGESCGSCAADCGSCCPDDRPPVYPGAQGFGRCTPAGRTGAVLRVTSLADAGDGSLRQALMTPGPRVVVFEVGGEIALESQLVVREPYLTIAGQTAPSPGITLVGAALGIHTHDVLVQHLRVRPGDAAIADPATRGNDAFRMEHSPAAEMHDVVVDHCSLSWAVDNNVILYFGPRAVTFSNNVIGEVLHRSASDSEALMVATGAREIALLGNALISNARANPAIQDGCEVLVANNLIYNAYAAAPPAGGTSLAAMVVMTYGGVPPGAPTVATFASNGFIRGPHSLPDRDDVLHYAIDANNDISADSAFYLSDNVYLRPGRRSELNSVEAWTVDTRQVWSDEVQVCAVSDLKQQILAHGGARPRDRDEADQRMLADLERETTGTMPNCVEESTSDPSCDEPGEYVYAAGAYPHLAATTRPLSLPADPAADPDQNGFTALDELLHLMAATLEGRR